MNSDELVTTLRTLSAAHDHRQARQAALNRYIDNFMWDMKIAAKNYGKYEETLDLHITNNPNYYDGMIEDVRAALQSKNLVITSSQCNKGIQSWTVSWSPDAVPENDDESHH